MFSKAIHSQYLKNTISHSDSRSENWAHFDGLNEKWSEFLNCYGKPASSVDAEKFTSQKLQNI